MKFKTGYVILYLLFLAMGLSALVGGGIMLWKNLDLKFNGIHSKGIIVGAADDNQITGRSYLSGQKKINNSFFPVIQYLVAKDSIESATHSSANSLNIAIGDEVQIVFRPNEPTYVELPQMLRENIIVSSVCLLMGIVFTWIIGLIGIRSIRKTKD